MLLKHLVLSTDSKVLIFRYRLLGWSVLLYLPGIFDRWRSGI